jgi:dTDP-4-dehydrorhamnose reductase
MLKIHVTGANGQLGSEIKKLASLFESFEFDYTDVNDLDICNLKSVDTYLENKRADYIINCAAYTAVDKAESDLATARKVNVEAVTNLVTAANKYKSKLIHISTDYVFGSSPQNFPFIETDSTSPNSAYGITKLEGEVEAQNAEKHIVIRTSWLYSSFGNNFVKTILRLGKERAELGILFDQVGTPCYAEDLALAILSIVEKIQQSNEFKSGIYHYSNEGVCSWFDFAYTIIKLSGLNCNVKPILTRDYPLPANRPAFSVMNKSKIKETFGLTIPYWTDGLERCMKELGY